MKTNKYCTICESQGFQCNHCHKEFFLCHSEIENLFEDNVLVTCPFCGEKEIIENK